MQIPLGTLLSPNKLTCPSLLCKPSSSLGLLTRCESSGGGGGGGGGGEGKVDLRVGSPVIVVEAPPMLKTATSMPTLRVNSGQVKQGDVGRIVARKPKDVWAVRLAIGTYLIDAKHFKPLDLTE